LVLPLDRQIVRLTTLHIGETPRLSNSALDYSFANNDPPDADLALRF
jgi:hypothetical protein